ncbi:shikimate kinase [Ghiorsea bivora]|uniref:shikimate kinase n=1 Tax=Ghiorsea bivora TaxID=1485545 RepID=UPI0005718813|nr:shikimate kinase [Ghiorsea bivora]
MGSNIILVGLMGSGKSILGKQLASRLSLKLIDLDDEIVSQAGKSIPEIFRDEGEQSFRDMESEILAKALQTEQAYIIATGGGAVLSEDNRLLMKQAGSVIWLGASPEILAKRITGDSNRPLLAEIDPLAKMKALSIERNPLYEEVADLYVDTGKLTDEEAVAKIIHFLSD